MSKLTRRLLLKGFAGLGVALPALEFTHDRAWAQAAPGKAKRFITFFEHGGTIANVDREGNMFGGPDADGCVVDGWRPTSDGVSDKSLRGKLGPIHQPLVGFEDDLLVLRGVNNLAVMSQSPYAGDHGWANATALTNNLAIEDARPNGSFFNAQGPSIDAVIAERMAMLNPVPFPSVNLEVSAHNYGTPFFVGANQPQQSENNPTAAFSRLFTNVSSGGTPDARVLRALALKKSVLDGTSESLALYKNKVSARDKQTIDAHMSLIRGIEMQLEQTPVPLVGCMKPTITGPFASPGSDTDYGSIIPNVGPAQVDIMVAALQCGLTNVATLNIGDFYNDWMHDPYPAAYNIGHSLHHSANDTCPTGSDRAHFDDWYQTILDNRQWRSSMFARLLAGLKNMPEGSGNMLDNSLVLWTSEFSYGGQHSSANLPLMLAGKAGGYLRTGQHINYATIDQATGKYVTSATLNNVFTTCLNACGFPDTSFGATFGDHYSYYPRIVVCRSVDGGLPMVT
ncbi:MAG: DUF1552 domain-containing protein [Myxococcota bacterium]